MVKHASADPKTHVMTGPARVFDSEVAAVDAIKADKIHPGDVIVIRYEGPRATGMPEMFRATETLFVYPELRASTAIVTDGRFSGATRGPAIGTWPQKRPPAVPSPWWRRGISSPLIFRREV